MQPFVKPLVLSFCTSRYCEPSTFGDCIKKARLEKGLKQVDVARVVGVDEITIVNWERYETLPMRNRRKVSRACDFLGLTLHQLSRTYPYIGPLLG